MTATESYIAMFGGLGVIAAIIAAATWLYWTLAHRIAHLRTANTSNVFDPTVEEIRYWRTSRQLGTAAATLTTILAVYAAAIWLEPTTITQVLLPTVGVAAVAGVLVRLRPWAAGIDATARAYRR